MKLTKAIIKKYGISKKAWAIARGQTGGETTMARRKKSRSRSGGFKKSRGRRSSGGSVNPLKVVVPALIYGASRGYISNAIEPFTSKIPLGNYADEAVFGVAGYFMAKKGKGMIKDAGIAIMTVEAASLGSQLIGSMGSTKTESYDQSY